MYGEGSNRGKGMVVEIVCGWNVIWFWAVGSTVAGGFVFCGIADNGFGAV